MLVSVVTFCRIVSKQSLLKVLIVTFDEILISVLLCTILCDFSTAVNWKNAVQIKFEYLGLID